MKYPTIHMNGTPLHALQEANQKACDAIREAVEALAQAAPNGRDYYPQSADAIHEARICLRLSPQLASARKLIEDLSALPGAVDDK